MKYNVVALDLCIEAVGFCQVKARIYIAHASITKGVYSV